tara:strand:- start:105 stop:1316 length:1212 start_codon:yes stop_codon:yes gene_type:complete
MSKEEQVPQEGEFKMKKKPGRPRKLNKTDEPVKLDLTKKEENAVQEQDSKKEVLQSTKQSQETGQKTEVGLQEVGSSHTESKKPTEDKEVKEVIKPKEEEKPPLEEINIGEKEKEIEPQVAKTPETPKMDLPENVEKLVNFMRDTGGNIEDYVRLNADYTNVDGNVLLKEYYKQTKPHLDASEIDFLMEDKFYYDEDVDEERDIRKKKLAKKEEIAKAQNFLEETKAKYYDEIKLRPGVTQEQQKAMEFFNRYNAEHEQKVERHKNFVSTTNDYFNNDFKGFNFDLGEKKFRYGVNNPSQVAQDQSDISIFLKKFLNEDGTINDYQGYHKAMYAARNADTIAKHFYDQGVSDATKDIVTKSKNISKEGRQSTPDDIYINGLRVKAISGVDSSKLKIKKRKFNT